MTAMAIARNWELPPETDRLLRFVTSQADPDGKIPDIRTIAAAVDRSASTISSRLKYLERRKFLTRIRRNRFIAPPPTVNPSGPAIADRVTVAVLRLELVTPAEEGYVLAQEILGYLK